MSSYINARRYNATTQAVEEAIARSVSHTEIVTIDPGPWAEAIMAELREACDGEAESDGAYEFWGVVTDEDDEPSEWRVHVERS